MDDQLKQSALDFHEFPVPGKIQVSPTKPLATQRDLALAYSPGVAALKGIGNSHNINTAASAENIAIRTRFFVVNTFFILNLLFLFSKFFNTYW